MFAHGRVTLSRQRARVTQPPSPFLLPRSCKMTHSHSQRTRVTRHRSILRMVPSCTISRCMYVCMYVLMLHVFYLIFIELVKYGFALWLYRRVLLQYGLQKRFDHRFHRQSKHDQEFQCLKP